MVRITPPLRSRGVFSLRGPFVANPSIAYTVSAIRTFEEIRARGSDPMELIYNPAGLLKSDYESDIAEGAVIVTLMSATEKPIYIPDTYIDSYPGMGNIDYNWLIASISLGSLPVSFDTTLLRTLIEDTVAGFIGVRSVCNIGLAALTETVSAETHAQLLAARKGAITMNNTDRARALKAEGIVAAQLLRIQALEAYALTLLEQIPPPTPPVEP